MNTDYSQKLKSTLDKLTYSDVENLSGWTFTAIDESIIRFQPYGYLNADAFKQLSGNFADLQAEYFNHADFLVLLFDFTNFKKASSEVRTQIIEGTVFKNEKVSFAIYGMNYFSSTVVKIISSKIVGKRLFIVRDEDAALNIAKQLISNYEIQKQKKIQQPNYYSQPDQTINVGGKYFPILSRQAWTYNDPLGDYKYKIDLLDDDILISRPSGYIRYQNSVMANVLFDKVINSELGQNKKYYRIQDYTAVIGSENKARRDFNSYLLGGIDNINLLVFYGLNRIMWTVVRLGKLVHPAYEKVRIAKTFEEAIEIVIAHKYKNTASVVNDKEKQVESLIYQTPQEEIRELKIQKKALIKENEHYLNVLFDRISKITYGDSGEYIPVKIDESNPFYDLFSAVQLLYEDYNELKTDRNSLQIKLQRILSEHAREIRDLKIDNSAKLRSKENFIRSNGHELSQTLQAILNSIELVKQEEKPEEQKALFEIIRIASLDLQHGIGLLKSSIADKHSIDTISESMFNYRKNLAQLVKIARMGHPNTNVIFENTVEEKMPNFLIGDKRKFNQLVNIYLENALKFTSFGFIKIYTHVVSNSVTQTRFRLIVEDSGIGIDQSAQAQIFKEEDMEGAVSMSEIKGFGLLIAKNLARVLDAEVGFKSEKGVGSKFWVELAFNIGYDDKVSQMDATKDYSKLKVNKHWPFDGTRALLIMDEVIKQNLVGQMLRGKGIQSRIKLNYEFFEDIEGKFDFVFVSLQLTGGKELSSFKLLKNSIDAKNDYAKPIYIGCVDSFKDPILEEYKKVGVDYFIHKSFKINEFDQFFEDLK